ncbi:c-type cytochrome [Ostreiculturibacter nitratireducens]|uniref:c-type cytochrome n=1 Tax=Ostreiculturibacter nitratireducens TaxID=3075226 RepID=UPI0031B5BD91
MKHLLAVTAFIAGGAVSALPVSAQDADVGAALYENTCAMCHGGMGKGAGELADLLTVAPPDLTQLSKNNGGEFPMGNVISVIDGRKGVRAHGAPMPVFGVVFRPGGAGPGLEYGNEVEARGRTLSLALYLESIQAE